jgi:hypothetical protein
VAKAWEIQHLRKVQALEAGGWSRKADAERNTKKPWDSDIKGDPLSIQEWTGPAVFTDAVLSWVLYFLIVFFLTDVGIQILIHHFGRERGRPL